jgi:endonuclease/exonuclease/phosphatase family metal-dependent hydrolase
MHAEEASARETNEIHQLIRERIAPHYAKFATCGNQRELEQLEDYLSVESYIRRVLGTPQEANFSLTEAPPKEHYRFLAWNLERGIQYDGQLEALRSHPYLKDADVLLLTETDVGMARSGNRKVAVDLARQLGMYYAFVPCYLNLTKGSGVEFDVPGENELGLHGNAILSRYPISNVRPILLKNGIDKMASREKRIGRQVALAAEIAFPDFVATAVSVHLDAQSTQRHRYEQMRSILDQVGGPPAAVLGGDWNTSTYNSSHAAYAFFCFWRRVFMGVDNAIRHHYLHPYRKFEKDLFDLLEDRGFEYRASNCLGEHTVSYYVADERSTGILRDWVPSWWLGVVRWALRNHNGRCPLKLDWFATRGLQCADPSVIHDLREGREVPLSDHDAIGVDVRPL